MLHLQNEDGFFGFSVSKGHFYHSDLPLVAAAPDLLAVAKAIYSDVCSEQYEGSERLKRTVSLNAFKALEAAIAKATGVPEPTAVSE